MTFQRTLHKGAVELRNGVALNSGHPAFETPQSIAELLDLPAVELEQCDIARMNLLCAEGLPGAEELNVKGSGRE